VKRNAIEEADYWRLTDRTPATFYLNARFANRPDLRKREGAGRWAVHMQPHRRCTTHCRRPAVGVPINAAPSADGLRPFGFKAKAGRSSDIVPLARFY
jgi:hypothetical protein